jgi:hypothetical protein
MRRIDIDALAIGRIDPAAATTPATKYKGMNIFALDYR